MNSIFTFLLISGIVVAVLYTVIKTSNSETNKKADEVKKNQHNPTVKVDGLSYDTPENDSTRQ